MGVEQTDLNLPGRGLDLNVARVLSTPYVFHGTTPFEYDNYTLSNLGLGWSLNFPWMGTYYLHLSDGQAYPYQWSGNTFEYHKALDFKLVNNGNGYTLYAKDGTVYQFDSGKRLTTITDRTGNVITFAYGTNNYISQITDTVGRTVTFSYNANNQLTSISSGGRTWTYGYHGKSLVSMTDPLSRVTSYQNSTGINNWLISVILYPTGGKTTYSYGSAPVGTEAKTYYVTSRNIYSSATALSQSSSISYVVLNGNMISSSTTVADNLATRGYESYIFQNSKNRMYQCTQDSTLAVLKATEYDYDIAGRINQTKIIGPQACGLAGYWPLDEGSGSGTADLSNNLNIGTLYNSPTWLAGANCKYGYCLGFASASSQYVALAGTGGFPRGSSARTITLWIYPTSCGSGEIGFVEYGTATTDTRSTFGMNGCQLNWDTSNDRAQSSLTVPTNAWSFVAMTYPGSGKSVTFYLGITSATASLTGTPNTGGGNGKIGFATPSGLYYGGRMDDVRVYSRALSASEVSGLYLATTVPSAVQATSSTSYDSWGNVKYTKDFIGHETYFSYANTDSQNTFGAAGFTNSFYTPLTISANIHNAIVGRAELQNGPSTAKIETYFKYDSAGNQLEQKQITGIVCQ